MKSSPPLPLIRTGLAPVIESMRSVILPGMSCPIRQRDELLQHQLKRIFRNDVILVLLPGDHLETNIPRSVGCLARITAHQELYDGSTLSIFRGLARVSVEKIENNICVLPQVKYQLQQDFYPSHPSINRKHRREELLATFFKRFAGLAENDSVTSLLQQELPLGA